MHFRLSNGDEPKRKIHPLTKFNLLALELAYETDENKKLTCRIHAWLKESKATSNGCYFSFRGCFLCFKPKDEDPPNIKDFRIGFHDAKATIALSFTAWAEAESHCCPDRSCFSSVMKTGKSGTSQEPAQQHI
jgi:hypothetical protein